MKRHEYPITNIARTRLVRNRRYPESVPSAHGVSVYFRRIIKNKELNFFAPLRAGAGGDTAAVKEKND
jgi:hypothetical protein